MRRGLLIAALAGAFLACATPARATIVINRSIAGVAPGMTRAQAEARLGQPVVTWRHDSRGNLVPGVIDGGVPYIFMRYRRGVVLAWLPGVVPRGRRCTYPAGAQRKNRALLNAWVKCAVKLVPADARVQQISTNTPAERTASGIGVGSTFAQAKKALPVAGNCRQAARGRGLCYFAPAAPVRTHTRFVFENGRVVGVDMEGFGPCRPDDGCSGGGGGGGGSGTPSGTLTISGIECIPNAVSLAAGGYIECGVDVEGVDPQEDVASVLYSFGDGSRPGEYWAHTYTAVGTYVVTVTVVAKDGQRASASINVTVTA
jgi:hypothetical protein